MQEDRIEPSSTREKECEGKQKGGKKDNGVKEKKMEKWKNRNKEGKPREREREDKESEKKKKKEEGKELKGGKEDKGVREERDKGRWKQNTQEQQAIST